MKLLTKLTQVLRDIRSIEDLSGRTFATEARKTALTALLFVAASVIGWLFRSIGFTDTNTVVLYLLAVLITAWLTRSFLFGTISSLLATTLFGYLFAEPYFNFAVSDPNYIITFVTMTVTALITSTLTSHAKLSERAARGMEAETKAIYNLTNHLTDAKNIHDIAGVAVNAISACFSCNAACVCFDESGAPERNFIQQVPGGGQIHRDLADVEEYRHKIDGLRTAFDEVGEFHDWPVYGSETTLGVVRIPKETGQAMNDAQTRLLRAMIESTALAMDRFRLIERRIKSREDEARERYRAHALRAISRDFGAPLTRALENADKLLEATDPSDWRRAMAAEIREAVGRLNGLLAVAHGGEHNGEHSGEHGGEAALDRRGSQIADHVRNDTRGGSTPQ